MSKEAMTIVSLTAENVKRLRAVSIRPDGNMVVITGKNSQGKTSVLDAIWLALAGGDASRSVDDIIRKGEDKATATVSLGDIIVRRTWTRKDGGVTSKLEVTSGGATFKSPQTLLDEMLGALSFDPLLFARMNPADQAAALMKATGNAEALAQIQRERQEYYDTRTDIQRRARAISENLKNRTEPEPGTPLEEISAAKLISDITSMQAEISRRADMIRAHKNNMGDLDDVRRLIDGLRVQIAKLEEKERSIIANMARHAAEVDALPEAPNIESAKAELAGIESRNATIRQAIEYRTLKNEADRLNARATELTAAIVECETRKAATIRAAGLPVDGLELTEGAVTLNGVTLRDCSASEQLRVSVALAMRTNPQIRVIRIKDGSLLDSDAMTALADMAEREGYQVWIERVDDAAPGAVVIEDGAVAER